MSISSVKLAAWRESGSLRYLAHQLGISLKQAARYWDQGWIPGAVPRKKGGRHRRVRYADDTVARVTERVAAAKETNRTIRYGLKSITHRGRRIPVEGCTSMSDLYRRARAAGLSATEARRVASRRRSRHGGDPLWEATLASAGILGFHGLTLESVAEDEWLLSLLPLEDLLEASSPREFRARAQAACRDLCVACATREARRRRSAADFTESWQARIDRVIRPVLSTRDLKSFARAYTRAVETFTRRIPVAASPASRRIVPELLRSPKTAVLLTVLAAIREAQERPGVAAIARRLGVSRKTVYRLYGKTFLREALTSIRYDRSSGIHTGARKSAPCAATT